jgi:PTS system N-acetylgalactosamine-specific IIA component
MIGIILTGHGQFAAGLASALELIVGKAEQVAAVDFGMECSTEELSQRLAKAVQNFENCDKVLFLSDLPGGSPFRLSVLAGKALRESKVLAGANLPMLLEAVMNRKCDDLERLAQMTVMAGKDGIRSYDDVAKVKRKSAAGI